MSKATKNNGTFEALRTRDGMHYSANRERVRIDLAPADSFYHASLWYCDSLQADVIGFDAIHALGLLVGEMSGGAANAIITLAKDLYQFINRPARETYNSR